MSEKKSKYAIIASGGKQHRVVEGELVDVELLDIEDGQPVEFGHVLFVGNGNDILVGKPSLSEYTVKGEVVGTVKGPKIESLKYKRSHNQYRRFGHRQHYSRVKILEIVKSR